MAEPGDRAARRKNRRNSARDNPNARRMIFIRGVTRCRNAMPYAASGSSAAHSATSPAAIAAAISICRMILRPRRGSRGETAVPLPRSMASDPSIAPRRRRGCIAAALRAGMHATRRRGGN